MTNDHPNQLLNKKTNVASCDISTKIKMPDIKKLATTPKEMRCLGITYSYGVGINYRLVKSRMSLAISVLLR